MSYKLANFEEWLRTKSRWYSLTFYNKYERNYYFEDNMYIFPGGGGSPSKLMLER